MKFERIAPADAEGSEAATWIQKWASRTVSVRQLLILLLLPLLTANLLLLLFLGVGPLIMGPCIAASVGLLFLMLRLKFEEQSVSFLCLAGCIAFAGLIFVFGGEGRFLYANPDWQIRDAVLRDMTVNSWPFAYTGRGTLELLRAPVGMYLAPALLGKAAGFGAAEIALLVQNSLLLGILLALGSLLAETRGARAILLAVVVWFSGLDFLGELVLDPASALNLTSHIERWAEIQFSSHITLAFWVPQHAVTGWAGALLFLLWTRGRVPLAAFLAPMPLFALWSPLALAGILPFAAAASFTTLARRQLKLFDVFAPLFTAVLALPALIYLQTAGDTVGVRLLALDPTIWSYFQVFETFPFIVGVGLLAKGARPKSLLALSASWLALVPFVQVGLGFDFMMRASITALAVLAVLVGEALAEESEEYRSGRTPSRALLIGACCIGSITAIHEVARAALFRPTPLTRCDLVRTNFDHADSIGHRGGALALAGMSTYLAPVSAFPEELRPKEFKRVTPTRAARCWERPWDVRR